MVYGIVRSNIKSVIRINSLKLFLICSPSFLTFSIGKTKRVVNIAGTELARIKREIFPPSFIAIAPMPNFKIVSSNIKRFTVTIFSLPNRKPLAIGDTNEKSKVIAKYITISVGIDASIDIGVLEKKNITDEINPIKLKTKREFHL